MRNKLKIAILLLAISLIANNSLLAQVAISADGSDPDGSAMLHLISSDKGFLLPRMTATDRDDINSPADGLMIYNTTTNCINVYFDTKWFESCGEQVGLPPALGSTFTGFSNGGVLNEMFSANTECEDKLISAGHTEATCSSSVTIGDNTYDLVLIEGQCWMLTNLKEAPTAPISDPPNTGSNTWLAETKTDLGLWGYYNTTDLTGAAGWGTTEPAAGEGLLYQWSAAMNGSTLERSQGVCPTGWHIPSDCEWMYLEHGQGMSIAQQTTNNAWRNTTGEGQKLRGEGGAWNNSSGFTALLAGNRNTAGAFNASGSHGAWWSSSEPSATARSRDLGSSHAGVNRFSGNEANGFSVRCLKD